MRWRSPSSMLAVAIVGVVAAFLTACTQEPPAAMATYPGDGKSSYMDIAHGSFVIDQGCVYFDAVKPDVRYLPMFPEQSSAWDGDKVELGGTVVSMGQAITIEGGEAPKTPATHIPSACQSDLPLWILAAVVRPPDYTIPPWESP